MKYSSNNMHLQEQEDSAVLRVIRSLVNTFNKVTFCLANNVSVPAGSVI